MAKYWLVNESTPHYNLGLEKARHWLERQGHEVVYAPFSMEARAFDAVWFSVIFSWHLPAVLEHAALAHAWNKQIEIGGPATSVNAGLIEEKTGVRPFMGVDHRFETEPGDYLATFTHRGCIRNCSWCVVPKTEGDVQEIPDFIPAKMVHDNNFPATSEAHQVRAIERLSQAVDRVDFDQAFDARLFDQWHLDLYKKAKPLVWRFSFDFWGIEKDVERVCAIFQKEGLITRHKVVIYALVGFGEGMEKDIARVQRIAELGAYPYPMRYVPLDSLDKAPPAKGWDNSTQITRFANFFNVNARNWWKHNSDDDLEQWMKRIKPDHAGSNSQLSLPFKS